MPTPYESARLNLQLFELRREPVLREARDWFLRDFNPTTFVEAAALVGGPRNASFRMVLGYWDMAASMVTFGAIDAAMFLAAHGEIVSAFAKIAPFLAELRAATNTPEFCRHVESVLMAQPGMAETLEQRRAVFRLLAERRAAAETAAGEAELASGG